MRKVELPDDVDELTVRDTARAMGVHENTIRNWINAGVIAARVLPHSGYHRIPRSEVERLLREEQEEQQ